MEIELATRLMYVKLAYNVCMGSFGVVIRHMEGVQKCCAMSSSEVN